MVIQSATYAYRSRIRYVRLLGGISVSRNLDSLRTAWHEPVRAYMLAVATVVIASTAVTMLVLGGLIPDGYVWGLSCPPTSRVGVTFVLVSITLLIRITIDVLWATAPETTGPRSPSARPARP